MRTLSLAFVVAASAMVIACSGKDEPAPAEQQPAAVVAPTDPSKPASTDAPKTDGAPTAAADPAKTDGAADKKADAPAAGDKKGAEPKTDGTAAFADAASKLNDCLKACTDQACGTACLSDFQASLPATPDVPTSSSMCCSGAAFFVCHSADGGDATCNADQPGPACQPVPAMDVICKAKGQ